MDKNSAAYQRAIELDRKGLAQRLRDNSNEFFLVIEEEEKQEMGSSIGVIVDKAQKVMGWALESGKSDDEEEFEYGETQNDCACLEEPKLEDPNLEDSELELDTLIEREKERLRSALNTLRTVFPHQKLPTFSLPVEPKDLSKFQEFVDWINQTSGKNYIITGRKNPVLTITKLSDVDYKTSSVSTSVQNLTDSNISPVGSITSVSTSHTWRPLTLESSSKNLTANSQSLMTQLTNGVILPPRGNKGKKKKVTLSGFGIPENEVMGLVAENPNIKMELLFKKLYQRKGN